MGACLVPDGAWTLLAGAGAAPAGAAAGSGAFLRRPRAGGGAFGTGSGCDASLLGRPPARVVAVVGLPLSRTARRPIGPLTGARGTNTHPTWGTGLPPMRRPSSKSHG